MTTPTEALILDLGSEEAASLVDRALGSGRPLVLSTLGGDYEAPPGLVPSLLRHPLPVAGVLGGEVHGALATVLLGCDVLYWAPRAVMRLEPSGRGEAVLLSLRLGSAGAARVWFAGGKLGRREALKSGWAVAAKDHGAAVREAASRCAGLSAAALEGLRTLLYHQHGLALGPAWTLERAAFALAFAGGDPAEGVAAFLEKRKPKF